MKPQGSKPASPTRAWRTVIGLEVHCQLGTRTKLFCACAVTFGAEPNTHVCPVCSAAPGSLPVANAEAEHLAARAALALGCTVDRASRFDRKQYFYCDLPKGYQITQYDRGEHTLVDLNRAGVPLIEIVSEPDMESGAEAHEYLTRLKETLQFAGVSECDMEKGSLRCDVNVSVRRGDEPLGTRVELKNLNSFKNVVAAIEHEVARQVAELEAGRALHQETRLWDAERGETRSMPLTETRIRTTPTATAPRRCLRWRGSVTTNMAAAVATSRLLARR